MSRRRRSLRNSKYLLAHIVHLIVVLLPTLLWIGPHGIDWTVGCFAVGISAAAILESRSVVPASSAAAADVCDAMALRVAWFVGTCLLVLFWLAQIEYGRAPRHLLPLQATGGALLCAGIVLRTAAMRALGEQFVSDIRVSPTPVREGIYAWLRHPSEIGLMLIAVGGPLLLAAPLTAITATAVLLPLSLWRAHRENAAWVG